MHFAVTGPTEFRRGDGLALGLNIGQAGPMLGGFHALRATSERAFFPRAAFVGFAAFTMVGCSGPADSHSHALVAVDDVTLDIPSVPLAEAPDAGDAALSADGGTAADAGANCTVFQAGALLEAISDVNLRSGASTSQAVIEVVPTGAVVSVTVTGCAQNGFLPIKHSGLTGWSYASYYKPYTAPTPGGADGGTSGGFSRTDAIARARQSVGFAYWWGHGRWRSEGIKPEWRGTCTGSCPNCTFAGTYGADCSGMVAKAWMVPASNSDVSVDSHPFGTVHFVAANSRWSDVSRGALLMADVLVYRENGAGHMMLYVSGDGWGSVYAYECKGCSVGCTYNLRTVSSKYKGIRRAGW